MEGPLFDHYAACWFPLFLVPHRSYSHISLCFPVQVFLILLPFRPPSLTYWGLGVMLEPYVRHVVYISGDSGGDQQTAFSGAPIIFIMPITP